MSGKFERAAVVSASFGGVIGERLRVGRRNWLCVAPMANPKMLTMFDHTGESDTDPNPHGVGQWSGEYAGKYLISAVQDLRMSHDDHLSSVVAEVVSELVGFQTAKGYLGPYGRTGRVFGDGWDVWGHYHCVLGLYEWFRHTGDQAALDACLKAAHYLFTRLSNGAIRHLKYLEKNTAFAHVAALLFLETGHPELLALVDLFEEAWTTLGGGNYIAQLQSPTSFYTAMTGTTAGARWERLHSLQAIGELYRINGDGSYLRAVDNAWQGICEFDRHITGGFSSVEMATGNPFDPRSIETCATVAWMAYTVDVLRLNAWSHAADELELSTWNAVLGAQSPDGRWCTYDTPMGGIPTDGIPIMGLPWPSGGRGPLFGGARRPAPFDLGWQQEDHGPYLSCCAMNGPRGLGVLSEWAVMIADDGLVMNFYGPSTIAVRRPSGNVVTIEQQTQYPVHAAVDVIVMVTFEESFTLQLRIPAWSTSTAVSVNGVPAGPVTAGSYHTITRTWRSGDRIALELDLRTRPQLGRGQPDHSDPDSGHGAAGQLALYRGPILLAYDERYDRFSIDEVPSVAPTAQLTVDTSQPSPEDNRLLRMHALTDSGQLCLGDFATATMTYGCPADLNNVAGRVFQFGRGGTDVIAQRIRLLDDGTVEGYRNDNEALWGWQDDFLTFFAKSGEVTTKFTWYTLENGRAVLRGRFSDQVMHELREVDMSLEDRYFQFSQLETGKTLAPFVRLREGGAIEGHQHFNEHSWALDGENLIFLNENGDVSTRFTDTHAMFGRVDRAGKFLFPPPGTTITHRLRQLDPTVTGKVWQFRRPAQKNLPERTLILLHRDGTIFSDHPNERLWSVEAEGIAESVGAQSHAYWDPGPSLLFQAEDGHDTTRFNLDIDDDGRMHWTGPFLDIPGITHHLVEWNIDLSWSDSRATRYRSWLPTHG